MDLDDRLRGALERAARPSLSGEDVLQRLSQRKRQYRAARRLQAVVLAVAVVAGTTGVGLALRRAFTPDPRPATRPSAANGLIAFVRDGDIWAVNPDGSEERRLTSDPRVESDPAWSPDGTRIAYVVQDEPGSESFGGRIHILDVRTGESAILPVLEGELTSPAWSPDGSQIAFDSVREAVLEVWVVNVDGSDLNQLTHQTQNGEIAASGPAWSPDGSTIAFERFVFDETTQTGANALWTIRSDGRELRNLTDRPGSEGHPDWSPDGTRLAYYLRRQPESDLLEVLDLRSGATAVLTEGLEPEWSPDGRHIAFWRLEDESIYAIRPGDTQPRLLIRNGASPAWQPLPRTPPPDAVDGRVPDLTPGDSELIAFARDGDVFVVSPEGKGLRQLTRTAAEESNVALSDTALAFVRNNGNRLVLVAAPTDGSKPTILSSGPDYPAEAAWSPDGSEVAYSTEQGVIHVVAKDGSDDRTLTDTSISAHHPTWSPDGRQIAFTRDVDNDMGFAELWVMNADGSRLRPLVTEPGNNYRPAWSPTGETIAFISDRRRGADVWTLHLPTGVRKRLTNIDGVEASPSWSPDGRQLVYSSEGDLWIVRADGSGLHRLTEGSAVDLSPSWGPAQLGP